MITKEKIIEALSHVQEPDLGKDLITLNMVKDITVDGNKVEFTVVLTTPACPLKEAIEQACVNAIKLMVDKEAVVKVNMTASVTSRREESRTVLPGVKNIIAVVSGKGGVGKSTVATNLAIALSQMGAKVGIIDADIYGPSMPLMFGLEGKKPSVTQIQGKNYLVPIEKYGVKVLSIGFLVDPKQATIWRGPIASSALRQFVNDTDWGELDYLVVDMPPGTGDIHLTLVQTVPVTGAVIVTTPQPVALADARKAISMFQTPQINVPILGIVENMAYFTPAELPENKYYIFGKDGGANLAKELNVVLLGQIPIVQSIREGGDAGIPAAVNEKDPITQRAFLSLGEQVARQIAIRNASLAPTQKVEITIH
ncbi:MAG: Mrp/NBP35 family ATP-binding protein [Bacteroidia bacterium]|nr:Mrp/NBP35 family ATP-binding protein [Bacteroidia bacterium]MDW8347542.1 Mrp/NBP35 family ATP-binding protein [Bacteroidia bacterium]